MKKYLYGHTNFENAYEVDGYPWGFRLKTKVRYWIETVDKKNGGQRLVKQTLNPKNNKWCSPKKSTYNYLTVLYLDENNHVQSENMNPYNSKEKDIKEFIDLHKEHLTDYEKKTLRFLDGYNKTMKTVNVEIVKIPFNESEEEKEQRIHERKQSEENILKSIKYNAIKSEVI